RLNDPEQDGYPGVSAYVSTTPPSSPSQDATGLLSARALTASMGATQWTITPAADGKHWATIHDTFTSSIVGCLGGGCSALGATAPTGWTCPERFNKAQFIPATAAYDTCAEILDQRNTLFATNQDGDWPSNASCAEP
ncbi:MAG TPA: hypothetical protein VG963_25605, partial [Polyangiaceae bacterium]|nr:hypothetical protein [Polyangiaceae bacterium]